MKNFGITAFLLCALLVHGAHAKKQTPEQAKLALKQLEGVKIPPPANKNAFGLGEYLDFGVYVKLPGVGTVPLIGGHGILSIPTVVERDGNLCFWLRSLAFSSGLVGQVYPVSDTIESFMDATEFFTRNFRKSVREGNFKEKYQIKFDQENHRATRDGKKGFDVETFPRVQDIISAFYYIRTLNFSPGDTIPLPYHDNGGNYPINVICHRTERVSVPAGKFDCLVIEPVLSTAGLFDRKGQMWVWVTNDARKMPVKMVSKIPVGSVEALLLEYIPGDTTWRQ